MQFTQVELVTMGVTFSCLDDKDKGLLFTNPTTCAIMGVEARTMDNLRARFPERMPTLSTQNFLPNDAVLSVMRANKEALGLDRVRTNTVLWPLDSLLAAAFHLHTDRAWTFHQEGIRLLKETIRKTMISKEQFNLLESQVREFRSEIKAEITRLNRMTPRASLVMEMKPN